jgi:hypothetical protein
MAWSIAPTLKPVQHVTILSTVGSCNTMVSNKILHRVIKNYRSISLRHDLSRKCRKIVKYVSITQSERNIWNGPIVDTVSVSWNMRDLTVLWRFNARSDGNLDVVVTI